jgi:hypothetical protein
MAAGVLRCSHGTAAAHNTLVTVASALAIVVVCRSAIALLRYSPSSTMGGGEAGLGCTAPLANAAGPIELRC